ncbi:hypothetical protein MCEMIEM13_02321 [Comamonadaceae bacterium]
MEMAVISQTLTISSGSSKLAVNHGLVITVKALDSTYASIVYGAPGAINASKNFELGDAALYETPSHGIVEVRLMSINGGRAEVLLTKISPRLGFATAINAIDEENRSFTTEEVLRIKEDIERIKISLSAGGKFSPEQEIFLSAKFSEILAASERMGRKDWIMYVSGTLTSVITSAAFDPAAASALISAFNANLSWVFQNMLRLIG